MFFLGIESTCDETGCAIVKDGNEILSNAVASQIDLHNLFGGVVPELACRRHIDVLVPVIQQALKEAGLTFKDLNGIAVANGPGLIGAILVGLNAAKALAVSLNLPFVAVNHVEAHLYAALMNREEPISFPALGVVLSGGHTALLYMEDIGTYQLISQTVDDAIGEAFDKVAKILGLRYPGGPEIEALAKTGDPSRYSFTAGQVKEQPLAFSFSGLKTAVLYAAKGQKASYSSESLISEEDKKHVAAAFQETAFEDIVKKAMKATKRYGCKSFIFGGGVCNNQKLRSMFEEAAGSMQMFWPSPGLTLDNAAMIAGLGYHKFQSVGEDLLSVEAKTSMSWLQKIY